MLSMESTSNRMSRLGKSLITDAELLSFERIIAEIDARRRRRGGRAGGAAAGARAALRGRDRAERGGLPRGGRAGQPGAARRRPRREGRPLRPGRQGRARRSRRGSRRPATSWSSSRSAEATVDFTRPDAVVGNVGALPRAGGRRASIGTTGFDRDRRRRSSPARPECAAFHAPNFALGAVLMMRFAAEAAAQLPRAEIVELHNEAKVDAPSGTALATAAAMGTSPRSTPSACPGSSRTRRCSSAGTGSC